VRRFFVLVLLSPLLGPLLATPPARAAVPPYHPSRLSHLGDSRQVVVVTSQGWGSSYATLRAYRRDAAGEWQLRYGPWSARVGWKGMARAAERRQDSGTTPAGTFGLSYGFGSAPDPGTRLDYRRFDKSDWWVYDPRDPRTYNVWEPFRSGRATWRRGWAEHLWDWAGRQYSYGVALSYNLPSGVHWSPQLRQRVASDPADTRRGGGIFLHVKGSGATAGCVAVGRERMRTLLRWLDRAKEPRVVIGPTSAIDRL
jgi:L,D-peptidoglycan transpeptidase YkuD (ErfK/YbiS/YcfS/YnhG family)